MPSNIQIIHAEDFIRARPDGSLNFTESKSLLHDLVTGADVAGTDHILLDTRAAHVNLSMIEIFDLGVAVAGEGALRGRKNLALLVRTEKRDNAGFFETVSVNRGAKVKAFTDFETAIAWLIMKE